AGHPLRVAVGQGQGNDPAEAVAEQVDGFVDAPVVEQGDQVVDVVGHRVAVGRHVGAAVAPEVVEVDVGGQRHRVGDGVVPARQVVDHQAVEHHHLGPPDGRGAAAVVAAQHLDVEREAVGRDL